MKAIDAVIAIAPATPLTIAFRRRSLNSSDLRPIPCRLLLERRLVRRRELGAVASFANRLDECVRIRLVRIVRHRRRPHHEIHDRVRHAGLFRQAALDSSLARRARHSRDGNANDFIVRRRVGARTHSDSGSGGCGTPEGYMEIYQWGREAGHRTEPERSEGRTIAE